MIQRLQGLCMFNQYMTARCEVGIANKPELEPGVIFSCSNHGVVENSTNHAHSGQDVEGGQNDEGCADGLGRSELQLIDEGGRSIAVEVKSL